MWLLLLALVGLLLQSSPIHWAPLFPPPIRSGTTHAGSTGRKASGHAASLNPQWPELDLCPFVVAVVATRLRRFATRPREKIAGLDKDRLVFSLRAKGSRRPRPVEMLQVRPRLEWLVCLPCCPSIVVLDWARQSPSALCPCTEQDVDNSML